MPKPRAVRYVFAVAGVAALVTTGFTATLTPEAVAPSVAARAGALPVANVTPRSGEVVGVGMPVTITFATPIGDRKAAEDAITFASPNAAAGNFTWVDDATARFTPTGYWPAHSTIALSVGGFKTNFETGASVVGVADLDAHTFTVSIDGQVARQMPASMGKPKHPTPIGSFTALEKQSPVIMDSRTIGIPLNDPEGYKLTVYNAVRVTWGGVYVHGAPWSVGSQGKSNVSHGCINLSADNAAWYYSTVNIGDPIIVQA